MKSRMRAIDLTRMFLRSFLVQGSWNHKSMLGLGFGFTSIPFITRIHKTQKAREECLRRHIDFFNAHPYFASWCVGAVAKLEAEARRKKWDDWRPIEIFKERLAGPLGAIGDRLFWNGIKPAVSGAAIALALLAGWVAVPFFLILYNIPHLLVRATGIREGYRKGFDIVSDLSMRRYQKWFDLVTFSGSAAAGFCLVSALHWSWHHGASLGQVGFQFASSPGAVVPVAVFGAAVLLTLVLLHYRIAKHWIILLAALSGILISLVVRMF